MDKNELYRLLDIDCPEDFKYFDSMAALMECEEEIEYVHLAEILEKCDREALTAMIEEFFDDVTDSVPGSETEIFTILDNEKNALMGMARNLETENFANFTDEFDKFRRWYSIDSRVYVNVMGELEEQVLTLRDALTTARLEGLGGDRHYYDFSESMNYSLDDYVMSFKDMIALAEEDEDEEEYDEL